MEGSGKKRKIFEKFVKKRIFEKFAKMIWNEVERNGRGRKIKKKRRILDI